MPIVLGSPRTYRATDPAGTSATVTQVIPVNDVTPPQLIGLAPTQASLWSPNHSMKNITLSYSAVDSCTTSFSPQVTASAAISKVETINNCT